MDGVLDGKQLAKRTFELKSISSAVYIDRICFDTISVFIYLLTILDFSTMSDNNIPTYFMSHKSTQIEPVVANMYNIIKAYSGIITKKPQNSAPRSCR